MHQDRKPCSRLRARRNHLGGDGLRPGPPFFLARPSVGWKNSATDAVADASRLNLELLAPRGGCVVRRGEELSSRTGGSGRRPGAENSVAWELAEL